MHKRSDSLKRTATAAISLVALLSGSAAAAETTGGFTPAAAQEQLGANTFEDRVLRQINKRREAHGRKRVRVVDPCLDRLAEEWAQYLASTGLLVHRDQTGILISCQLSWAGEALARGSTLTPKSTVTAWMRSKAHRAVIMKRRANRAGLGVRYDDQDRAVVVLNFGDAE